MTDTPPEDAEKLTVTQQLVLMAEAQFDLGQSDDRTPFAKPTDGTPVVQMMRGSGSLRQELAASLLDKTGKVPSAAALADTLAALEGRALRTDPTDLHLRVGPHPAGVALDLGRPDGRTVVVGPDGWTVTTKPGLLWRRTALTAPMPDPVGGGDPRGIGEFINIQPEDLPLMLAWMVAALLPDMPHPLALLTGEQGSGKSVAARTLARLLDPSPAELRSCPRTLEEWAVSASGSWLVPLDNVSTIQPWLSDALCRAATGDGMVRRRLYHDNDVSVLSFRRVVLLTSIDAGALRGDLAERLVVLDLQRLGDRRTTEEELESHWDQAHPKLLGALLDLTSDVLRVLPGIHLDHLPRMADFARVVAAVDSILGTKALARYVEQSGRIAADVIDADPLAVALLDLIEADEWIEDTASGILGRLELARGDGRPPRGWPTSPQKMSGALTRLSPALREQGVFIDFLGRQGHGRDRLWQVGRAAEDVGPSTSSSSSSASSAPDLFADDADNMDDPIETPTSNDTGAAA